MTKMIRTLKISVMQRNMVKAPLWIRVNQMSLQKQILSRNLVYSLAKKTQTKYIALNINGKLTMEQRRILERVFDLITQEYDKKTAEDYFNTISTKF